MVTGILKKLRKFLFRGRKSTLFERRIKRVSLAWITFFQVQSQQEIDIKKV